MPYRTPRTQAEKHTRPELLGPPPETRGELAPGTEDQLVPASDTQMPVPSPPFRDLRKV